MAAIGRLFVEIGAKTTLPEDLARAQESLKAFGEKATKSGLTYLAAFEASLNPTKKLAEELRLLERAGKSSGDIVAVLGDRVRTLAESARAGGRLVRYHGILASAAGSRSQILPAREDGEDAFFPRHPGCSAALPKTGRPRGKEPIQNGFRSSYPQRRSSSKWKSCPGKRRSAR